jgi:hypothetical protein
MIKGGDANPFNLKIRKFDGFNCRVLNIPNKDGKLI